jgi:lysophospholipid acyltransferase (LPLAT)-like uncharacterized protein
MVPLPFSRILVSFGQPVKIGMEPVDFWQEELRRKLDELESGLMAECR